MPTKCIFLLLKRLFYGVTIDEDFDTNANTYTNHVSVSYEFKFSSLPQTSQIGAKNAASGKALKSLCEIQNHFVQRKQNYIFPSNFAEEIQK